MYYKAIPITQRFPELNKFVTTIDEAGEHRVYRLTDHGWNMRDMDGSNSPNNNLVITHWLEKVDSNIEEKVNSWDKLNDKIGDFYWRKDEDGQWVENNNADIDLSTIGELVATTFNYI